jgi:hypothetical protein
VPQPKKLAGYVCSGISLQHGIAQEDFEMTVHAFKLKNLFYTWQKKNNIYKNELLLVVVHGRLC